MSHLTSLPDDVLWTIAHRLNSYRDVLALCSTNIRYSKLCTNNLFWYYFYQHQTADLPDMPPYNSSINYREVAEILSRYYSQNATIDNTYNNVLLLMEAAQLNLSPVFRVIVMENDYSLQTLRSYSYDSVEPVLDAMASKSVYVMIWLLKYYDGKIDEYQWHKLLKELFNDIEFSIEYEYSYEDLVRLIEYFGPEIIIRISHKSYFLRRIIEKLIANNNWALVKQLVYYGANKIEPNDYQALLPMVMNVDDVFDYIATYYLYTAMLLPYINNLEMLKLMINQYRITPDQLQVMDIINRTTNNEVKDLLADTYGVM